MRVTMLRAGRGTVAMLALAAVVAACSNAGTTAVPATVAPVTAAPVTAAPATAGPTAAAGLTLAVSQSTFGEYVAGKDGLALYVFEKDNDVAGGSACYGDCAGSWPPLTVTSPSDVAAGSGVTGELGTITRTDGALQVPIDGHPVYYFAGDSKAGDVNGQGKFDIWYLVSPAGEAVGEAGEATAAPGASTCSGPTCY
jgi:predicted lipoprotein with Yx(FWY)xxD motif